MKVKIEYKTDNTEIPYCAFTKSLGSYTCEWSAKSFEHAKEALLARLRKDPIPSRPSEEVEI